jgi:hypothetical protein
MLHIRGHSRAIGAGAFRSTAWHVSRTLGALLVMLATRTVIQLLAVPALLFSGPTLARAQAPGLDSVLIAGVGHRVRIWRADDRSGAPLEGSPQFIHDSSVTVLLPDDRLLPVPLSRIVRVSELERTKPPNLLYFKFGGIIAGAVAGAIIGHNVTRNDQGSEINGPGIGSVIGAIGGALVGGIIGSTLGSLSHPRQRWVTVYRR